MFGARHKKAETELPSEAKTLSLLLFANLRVVIEIS
jgi:hypothetical protein